MESGRFQQLTEAETGAYHACVCQQANTVAYLDNGAVWILDLKTLEQRKLYAIPRNHRPDLLSIDDSGRYIAFAHCLPLEKALGPDQTHHSWLVRINTDGSGFKLVREEDFWISHVLINPTDPDTILFCHEGSWEVVAQRLWVVQADGTGLRKIRVEETPEVAIGHEIWTERGGAVNYHGSYKRRAFIGRVKKDGSAVRDYTMTAPSGHTSASEDGRLVLGDGTVEYPYISLYTFKGSVAIADPLCGSGRVNPAGLHAHANFSADGKLIVFGSERGGQANVYVVKTGA
jgi:oligogalacturonide lyase